MDAYKKDYTKKLLFILTRNKQRLKNPSLKTKISVLKDEGGGVNIKRGNFTKFSACRTTVFNCFFVIVIHVDKRYALVLGIGVCRKIKGKQCLSRIHDANMKAFFFFAAIETISRVN